MAYADKLFGAFQRLHASKDCPVAHLGDRGKGLQPLPTVVCLGLKLPKLDGLEVLPCIRADTSTKRLGAQLRNACLAVCES